MNRLTKKHKKRKPAAQAPAVHEAANFVSTNAIQSDDAFAAFCLGKPILEYVARRLAPEGNGLFNEKGWLTEETQHRVNASPTKFKERGCSISRVA